MRGCAGVLLACLVVIPSAAKKSAAKESPAGKECAAQQWNVNVTIVPQSEDVEFAVVKEQWSNDFHVYQCKDPPCFPSKLQAGKQGIKVADVFVSMDVEYGQIKLWIPEKDKDFTASLGYVVRFELDPSLKQSFQTAMVNDFQDVLEDLKETGEIVISADDEGGHSIEVTVLSLKSTAFAECAWSGEDCFPGKCCKLAGMTCYLKDDYWGLCRPTGSCKKGIDEADGQEWTCKAIGDKPELDPLPPAPEDQIAGTALFCFTISTPLTYEEELIASQKKHKAGVFACDESAVYDGAKVSGKTKVLVVKDWTAIWDEARKDGLWKKTDWTVKAQPDCVFSPQRVKLRLQDLSPYADAPLYLKSSKDGTGISATFMLMSSAAAGLLFEDAEDCKSRQWIEGENAYLETCLDASGANHLIDTEMIGEKKHPHWDLQDASFCEGEAGVYRPFQQAKHWLDCHKKLGASVAAEEERRQQEAEAEAEAQAEAEAEAGGDDGDGQGDETDEGDEAAGGDESDGDEWADDGSGDGNQQW